MKTLRAVGVLSGICKEHRIQNFFHQNQPRFPQKWVFWKALGSFFSIANCYFPLLFNFKFFPQFVTLEKMWKWGFRMFERENKLLLEKVKSPYLEPQACVKVSTESRSLLASWKVKLSCNIPANSCSHSECYSWLLSWVTNQCRGKFNYLSGTK